MINNIELTKNQNYAVQKLKQVRFLWLVGLLGSGKSIVGIQCVHELQLKTLMVAPINVLKHTWKPLLNDSTEQLVTLCNPDSLHKLDPSEKFLFIIIDESSKVKKSWKAWGLKLTKIIKHSTHILLMTGTPMTLNSEDIAGHILYFKNKLNIPFSNISDWRERYMSSKPFSMRRSIQYDATLTNAKKLLSHTKKNLFFLDAIHHVPLAYKIINLELESKTRIIYQDFKEKGYMEHIQDDEPKTSAVKNRKLSQIASGFYIKNSDTIEVFDVKKLNLIQSICKKLNDQGRNVLIFCNFIYETTSILTSISGSSTLDVDDWNSRKINVMVLNAKQCAFGLNLQYGGHDIIWASLPNDSQLFQQANARLARYGQQNSNCNVFIILAPDTIDIEYWKYLVRKDKNQNDILQHIKKITSSN